MSDSFNSNTSAEDKPTKTELLQLLSRQKSEYSIREIIAVLGVEYKERTLRRWLAEWVDALKVERIGNGRNTKYRWIAQDDTADFRAPTENRDQLSGANGVI